MSDSHPLEIPGMVAVSGGCGGLSRVCVTSPCSTAEIYPHGAHVTGFRKNGEPPLLFMSDSSVFRTGKAIRGGIPIIFPWFGDREGHPAHGYARTAEWEFHDSSVLADGSIRLVFRLPASGNFEVMSLVTVGECLSLELDVRNAGESDETFENCFHTYFEVGDIDTVSIHGLTGCGYFDKVASKTRIETAASIRIAGEVDRVYSGTTATVEITDPTLGRTIRVAKSGSASTVVWNPWIAKSKAMADFGDNEYRRMVCVESGNVGEDKVTLSPGDQSTLKMEISSGDAG